ncbi:MAG: hypothetical protein KAH34_06390, partial [Ketobacter sp.]|nr:hypothetical protein [Ketobacter sp.]
MSSALHAFMDQLVDYAGLFPPTALDMATAVSQYAGFQGQSESWMLGRFIVPADRLSQMAAAVEGHLAAGERWGVSALLGHRENAEQSLGMLQKQCQSIIAFEAELAGRATVEVLEVPLPSRMKWNALPTFLNDFLDGLEEFGVSGRELFLEIPPSAAENTELHLLEAVAKAAASGSGPGRTVLRLGAKLRCGGVTAEAFPSVDRVSRIIAHCRDLSLALKCTAGLHHPVRHQSAEPAVMMHGFLNVFGAGLLAHALQWDAKKLSRVVAETEPQAFEFEAGSFSWRGHSVQADTLRALRTRFLCGFGSCSF